MYIGMDFGYLVWIAMQPRLYIQHLIGVLRFLCFLFYIFGHIFYG